MINPLVYAIVHPEVGIAVLLLLVILVRVFVSDRTENRHPEDRRRVGRRAAAEAAVVIVLAGGLHAWRRYEPDEPAALRHLSTADLKGTLVVPHLDAPIPEGKTVVWCAAFGLAWDSFRRDLLRGAPVSLGPPASSDAVASLNAAFLPADTVDAESCVAVAGLGPEVPVRFAREVRERFGETVEVPALTQIDVGAFAWLAKDLPFAHPFENYKGGVRFGEGNQRFLAFGVNSDSESARKADILGQVVIHSATSRQEDEFVVEIAVRGGGDRLLLGLVPPAATLRGTWESVRAAVSGEGDPAPGGTVLAVPKMNFDIDHRFAGFEGAPVTAVLPPGSRILQARQRTSFRLDETGARLRASAILTARLGGPPDRFVFDRPYLLALVRRGAAVPYLLVWVGNEDLLAAE